MDFLRGVVYSVVFVFCFFLTIQLSAQENYLDGYILSKTGEEIPGQIDYRNWESNPQKIRFKSGNGEVTKYGPQEIDAFKVADELYFSAVVETEISPTQATSLEHNPNLILRTDTAFLQTLVKGKKSLFHYRTKEDRENFYIKEDGQFNLLYYKKYLDIFEGKVIATEIDDYKGQLIYYLTDCVKIRSKIDGTDYKKKELIKLFESYNECYDNDVEFEKKFNKPFYRFGVVAGPSFSRIKFRTDNPFYKPLVDVDFKYAPFVAAGLFVEVVLPRLQGKWSMYNELLYSSYSSKGKSERFINENNWEKYDYELGASYIKLNNIVRYKFPIKKLHLFCNVGMSNGFSFGVSNKEITLKHFYSSDTVSESLLLFQTRKWELGYIVGFGFSLGKLAFEARMEKGNGLSPIVGLASPTTKFFGLVSYYFN